MPDPSQFNTDRTYPGRWTITFSNPPINMFVPTTIVELGAPMTDLDADPSVKVVVFQSANPDFFIAHLDVSKAAERPGVLGLWRDFVLRLSSTPVVSIAEDFAAARAASVTSSCWPATCASPAGKAPYSATPRSASDWSRATERWNGSRAWSSTGT